MNIQRFWSVRFGAPNSWGIKSDGSFYSAYETQEYLNSLKYVRKMVEEKLTYQDFPVVADQVMKDRFISGQAGSYPRHIDDAYLVQNQMPNAKVGIISQLEGPNGNRTTGETGAGGIFLFTASSFKDDAKLKRALKFFDDLGSPEMSNLFQWGIEGIHWKNTAGKAEMIDPKGYAKEVEHLRNQLVVLHASINSIPGNLTRIMGIGEKMKKDNEQYAVFDPSLALVSGVQAEQGKQLTTMIEDAQTKFLVGAIDEAGWKAAVDAWKKAGGTRWAEELTALYKASKK